MKIADIAAGLILLALAIAAAAGTLDLPYWSEFSPGPAFAARWLALIAGVLAILLLWDALTRTESSAIEWPEREGARRVAFASLLLWAFVLALPRLGFGIAGVLFMLAMLLLVQRRAVLPSLIATAITVGASYALFISWLQIKLPLGPWGI